MEEEQKWEPLTDEDLIVWDKFDGYVAFAGTFRGNQFGSRLRNRNGVWEKRTDALPVIGPAETLGEPITGREYKEGKRPEKYHLGRKVA